MMGVVWAVLIVVRFLQTKIYRIAKTFCISNLGHGMYLSSPSEMQKFAISVDFS